jgi:RNA polymerase sigma-70 factor (ECF subfamily)
MTGRILAFGPILATSGGARAGRPAPAPTRLFGQPKAAADQPPLTPEEAERFRRLLLPHLDDAYRFARHLCRDATVAEDLVQDAYLRAFRGFRGFRGGDAKPWLFAVVRSSFLDWAAKQRRWSTTAGDDALEDLADEADTPEATLLREADDLRVRLAIDALPDPFREAVVLRELQEMSYRDIAVVTSAPIGTVMSRLARARRMLVDALSQEASR